MFRFVSRCSAVILLLAAAIVGTSTPASAQYFGRNKVQYRTFDFQVLRTEHFDIYFYDREKEGVDLAARMAERWNARLERVFRHQLTSRQPLVLYASHVDFEQTNVIGGEIGESTGGVTESARRRIVLPLAGPLADTDHVIGHELVHAFQFDITRDPDAPPSAGPLVGRLPLWFVEGMAEYLSIGPVDPNTAMWLRDAARLEQLPAVEDLDDARYFPYRWGQAFWAYVAGRWGDQVVGRMLNRAATQGVDGAIETILEITPEELTQGWHDSILQTYTPILTARTREGGPGRLVVEGEDFGADLNVAPSLSPDGSRIAFISSRSFFSVDYYIADTSTGEIVHRLTSTATDPHFASIQFLHSAGAWDADSRRLAIATVTNGRAALGIFDAVSGDRLQTIVIDEVDEVTSPSWAPSGDQIVFSGLKQGLTDLFVYDLGNDTVRRLTTDAYTDVQPVWSPDGTRIAFATDRFETDLSTLAIGRYQLALLDVASGDIQPVAPVGPGKHINPQWTPDGSGLYFIADREGLSNVYRIPVAPGGEPQQVTTVVTGISGITALSPAMSVAAADGSVAFSVYGRGKYDIFSLDAEAGEPPREIFLNTGVLPPPERATSDVPDLLANATLGLPDEAAAAQYPVEEYSPGLSLDGVSQPTIGVGVSQFGTSLGGGVALSFSDMLNNHRLFTSFQINSTVGYSTGLKDLGGQVGYLNTSRRWNWGLIGGQQPYVYGGYQIGFTQLPNGDILQTDQLIVNRTTERSVSGVLSYPLNRSARLELQGGMSHLSFDQIVRTQTFSVFTGQLFEDEVETISRGDSLQLGTASGAYVVDTSTFGATSPVQGRRSRLEVAPTFGSLDFTGVLADHRQYVMVAPFYTLAMRVMHFGRYCGGAEDPRIFPLNIGYPWLVRGYDVYSIDGSECVVTAESECEIFDRLRGSRMLVGNVELRFPLLRPFGARGNMYGPVPMEVALFADGGTAWFSDQRPSVLGGERDGIASAGVGLRANVLGFAVAEFDYVRPFQRTTRGWIFQFNLMPGW
jgi:Tol biopolymer transport system component